MSGRRETRSIRARVIAKAEWLCDGCGRWRPAETAKYVITEGRMIVGQLCVFCTATSEGDVSESIRSEAAQAGGIEDPFADDRAAVEQLWEEVFGGRGELAEAELTGTIPDAFRK